MQKVIYIPLFSVCFLMFTTLKAQEKNSSKTQVYNISYFAEIGGPGVFFSANFDKRFKPNERLGFGYRVGLGFTLVDDYSGINYNYRTTTIPTIPIGVNYLFGKPNSPNTFEVGAGVTVLTKKASILNYNDYTEGNLLGHFEFMYRRQPVDGGFSWRIGITPIINTDGDIFPFAAIGLGFSF